MRTRRQRERERERIRKNERAREREAGEGEIGKQRKRTRGKERERSIGQGCIHLAPPQVTPTCAIPSVGRPAYACGGTRTRTHAQPRVVHVGRARRCARVRVNARAPGVRGRAQVCEREHVSLRLLPRPRTHRRSRDRLLSAAAAASDSYLERRLRLLAQFEAPGARFASLRIGSPGDTFRVPALRASACDAPPHLPIMPAARMPRVNPRGAIRRTNVRFPRCGNIRRRVSVEKVVVARGIAR